MTLEGSINEINLIDRLVELARERFTGAIRFEREAVIKIIYFKEGAILSASTNDRADSIDEILLRAGKVTREHVRQALARRKENESLGDALLGLGFITRKELTSARRVQLVGIIRSLLSWNEGTFTIVHDYLPKREEGTAFSAAQVIVELIVTDEDRTRIDAAFGHGDVILRHTNRFDAEYRDLGLNADADAIVSQIDGSKTALEIAALTAIDAFTVLKLLHALTVLGLVEPMKAQVSHEISFAVASRIDPGDFEEPPPTIIQPAESFGFDSPPVRSATEEFSVDPDLLNDPVDFETLQIVDDETPGAPAQPSIPVAKPLSIPSKGRRRTPLVVAAVLALVLAAGAWAAWTFFLKGSAETPARPVVEAPKPAPRVAQSVNPAISESSSTPAVTDSQPPLETDTAGTASAPVEPPPQPVPVKVEPRSEPSRKAAAPAQKPVQQPPAGSSDPLRKRYDAMASDHARSHRGTNYTIQFELVCETDSITRALQGGGDAVWFVPISYKGRDCYRVFWGEFSTRSAGEKGLDALPQALRSGSKPVVIEVSKVLP